MTNIQLCVGGGGGVGAVVGEREESQSSHLPLDSLALINIMSIILF